MNQTQNIPTTSPDDNKPNVLRKIFLSCLIAIGVFLLILLFLFGGFLYLLSRTGLVEVPFFTKRYFHEPAPTYMVQASDKTDLNDKLNVIKRNLALNQATEIAFDEKEFTALINSIFADAAQRENYAYKIQILQTAVFDDALELFLHVQAAEHNKTIIKHIYLKTSVKPSWEENFGLKTEILSLQLGDLKLPLSVTNKLQPSLEREINEFLIQYGIDKYVIQAYISQNKIQVILNSDMR